MSLLVTDSSCKTLKFQKSCNRFAARQFTVRLGDIDLSTDREPSAPVTFKVSEVRAHPRFSRVGFYNDIAILVLEGAVRKSKYVIPVCMPQPGLIPHKERLPGTCNLIHFLTSISYSSIHASDLSCAGRRASVVGWGTTYYGGKESTVQRQAELPIWRNEDCNRAYYQPITDNFLCAGYSEGGVDACQGDSGKHSYHTIEVLFLYFHLKKKYSIR